jgi:cytochrome c553
MKAIAASLSDVVMENIAAYYSQESLTTAGK